MFDPRSSCQARDCTQRAVVSVKNVAVCEEHMARLADRLSGLDRPPSTVAPESLLALLQTDDSVRRR